MAITLHRVFNTIIKIGSVNLPVLKCQIDGSGALTADEYNALMDEIYSRASGAVTACSLHARDSISAVMDSLGSFSYGSADGFYMEVENVEPASGMSRSNITALKYAGEGVGSFYTFTGYADYETSHTVIFVDADNHLYHTQNENSMLCVLYDVNPGYSNVGGSAAVKCAVVPGYNLYQFRLGATFTPTAHDISDDIVSEDDPANDDPYEGGGGDTGDGSGEGGRGGGGDHDRDGDIVPIPELPDVSAVDTGLVTLYSPSVANLRALASFLWDSSVFDPDAFQKLFANPMDAILGLSIVPVNPGGTNANCVIGNVDTGVAMLRVADQYHEVDCGTVTVPEFWGAYLDYAPYTKLMLWLPYIGFKPITPDDVMGLEVNIKYHIDILSGSCVAYVVADGRLLYSYQGTCNTQIPISGNSYNNLLSSMVTIAGAIGATVATGGAAAPTAAAGIAQASINAMKPEVQRSGAISGSGGLMGVQVPYICMARPEQALPLNQNKLEGYPSLMSGPLSNFSGFTKVASIHLQNVTGTAAERDEIVSLLKEGVIL